MIDKTHGNFIRAFYNTAFPVTDDIYHLDLSDPEQLKKAMINNTWIVEFFRQFNDDPHAATQSYLCPLDEKTLALYTECRVSYQRLYNGQLSKIERIWFRFVEGIKSIFGCSKWQQARNRLGGYFALQALWTPNFYSAARHLSPLIPAIEEGTCQIIADNLMRYALKLEPKKEICSKGNLLIFASLLKEIDRTGYPPEIALEEITGKFEKIFGYKAADYSKPTIV